MNRLVPDFSAHIALGLMTMVAPFFFSAVAMAEMTEMPAR